MERRCTTRSVPFATRREWQGDAVKKIEDTLRKGKGAMPPRAGQNASDKEIKEAIEYMLGKVK